MNAPRSEQEWARLRAQAKEDKRDRIAEIRVAAIRAGVRQPPDPATTDWFDQRVLEKLAIGSPDPEP